MASGRNNGVCATSAGVGAIVCTVISFVFGVPMFITSMVLFSISNGDYDEAAFSPKYDDCSWSKWYDGSQEYYYSWTDLDLYDCDDGREDWEDWQDAKDDMRIAAIVLLVFCLLFIVCGVALAILMCVKMSQRTGGTVHSGTTLSTPVTHTATVLTVQQPQGYPMQTTSPVMPPAYNAASTTAPYPTNEMPPAQYPTNQMPPAQYPDNQMPPAQYPANPTAPNPQQYEQKY